MSTFINAISHKRVVYFICLALAACRTEAPSVNGVGAMLGSRLRDAQEVRFAFHGLEQIDGLSITVDDPRKVRECVNELTRERRWERVDAPYTEVREVRMQLLDADGGVLLESTILGRLIIIKDANREYWRATWEDGIGWATEITGAKQTKRHDE